MSITRRGFLEDLLAAGVLTGAISSTAAAPFTDILATPDASQTGSDAHEFWKGYFESLETTRGGGGKLAAQNRKVEYLHLSDSAGLRYLSDIKSDELIDYDGDVLVSASLGQFRPSAEDQELLQSVKSSYLRVDFMQTSSFMNLLAPMAWAALAVFEHDKPTKLPTLSQLGYQQAQDGRVLLPGGTGKFALNVYPVKPESTFHKIIRLALPPVTAAASVLGLPALSIPALKAITEMYLGPKDEMSHGKPLLNSLPLRWCATQQAYAESVELDKFPLIDGMYVMIPQAHAEELKGSAGTIESQRGYLMRKDASKLDSPDQRAMDAIPGVTYVTLSLKVTKVAASLPAQRTISGQEQQTTSSPPAPKSTPGGSGGGSGGGRPRPTPTPAKKPEDL